MKGLQILLHTYCLVLFLIDSVSIHGRDRGNTWVVSFAKQQLNIWRAMHTRVAPYIRHPVEQELQRSCKKRHILRNRGLQEGRDKLC